MLSNHPKYSGSKWWPYHRWHFGGNFHNTTYRLSKHEFNCSTPYSATRKKVQLRRKWYNGNSSVMTSSLELQIWSITILNIISWFRKNLPCKQIVFGRTRSKKCTLLGRTSRNDLNREMKKEAHLIFLLTFYTFSRNNSVVSYEKFQMISTNGVNSHSYFPNKVWTQNRE